MTQHDTTGQGILAAARQLQEQKIAAVGQLAESRAKIARIEAELAEARREDAVAYQAAVRGGWTEAELKAVGIGAPAVRAPGRPRGSGRRAPSVVEVERSGANALVAATLQREAETSVALDRDQTHVVGEPAAAS